MPQPPRLVLVLSENWTMVSPRDLRALVHVAVEAESAGVDTVMISEHVVLGPSSSAEGIMANPRDYAAPGNQDPATPWPDSIVLASAIAAATSRLRIALAAVIAPLRHPLLLAKQLATLDLLAEGGSSSSRPCSGRGRVRRARRAVSPPRGDPGRAARGDDGRLAGDAGPTTDGSSTSPTSTSCRSRTGLTASDVVRRRERCTAPSCGASSLRQRLPPVRHADGGGLVELRERDDGRRARHRRARDDRRDPGPFPDDDGSADLDEAMRSCPPSLPPATPRSASSPRCTPTIRPRSVPFAGDSWSGSANSRPDRRGQMPSPSQ